MNSCVMSAEEVSLDRMRVLLSTQLEHCLGQGAQVWSVLPCPAAGSLCAVDAGQQLWVLGFHPVDPGKALLSGLGVMDALLTPGHALQALPAYRRPRGLRVLAPQPPPGLPFIGSERLQWQAAQVVRIDQELALWLAAPFELPTSGAVPAAKSAAGERDGERRDAGTERTGSLVGKLSEEEQDFFAHL